MSPPVFVYVDDDPGRDEDIVRSAVTVELPQVLSELGYTIDPDLVVITTGSEKDGQALFLHADGTVAERLHGIDNRQVPSVDEINRWIENPQTIFILDISFGSGDELARYGIRLARYLKRRGVEASRILVLTHHPGDARDARTECSGLFVDFFAKEDLDDEDGARLLADRLFVHVLRLPSVDDTLEMDDDPLQELARKHKIVCGRSEEWRQVLAKCAKVADCGKAIHLVGETGTGKDTLARLIHNISSRRDGPLQNVNVNRLSRSVIESELFGHVKGAFTDAREARTGFIRAADKGTLFLNEIDSLPSELQVKLLNCVGEREKIVVPVGTEAEIKVDFRLITASQKDLFREVERGKFREDLYYRIVVVRIELPPLRARLEDIELFAALILPGYRFSASALEKLCGHGWPGNIRELENVLNRAQVFASRREIEAKDIDFSEPDPPSGSAVGSSTESRSPSDWMDVVAEVSLEFADKAKGRKPHTRVKDVLKSLIRRIFQKPEDDATIRLLRKLMEAAMDALDERRNDAVKDPGLCFIVKLLGHYDENRLPRSLHRTDIQDTWARIHSNGKDELKTWRAVMKGLPMEPPLVDQFEKVLATWHAWEDSA